MELHVNVASKSTLTVYKHPGTCPVVKQIHNYILL